MHTVEAVLHNRSWWHLRSTAHANGLKFNTKQTRHHAIEWLKQIMPRRFGRQLKHLTNHEKAALLALKAHDGQMTRSAFCAAFGNIRPHKPWRKDTPYKPWRYDATIAEKLWFQGWIDIERGRNGVPETIYAPQEVMQLLPPLPHPDYQAWQQTERPNQQAVLTDLALFLGLLMAHPIQPIHGKWLPLTFLREWNMLCTVKDELRGVRSERQSGRLKFLHYLATVGELIAVQNGCLLPTVYAWQWLAENPSERWSHLWNALDSDRASHKTGIVHYTTISTTGLGW